MYYILLIKFNYERILILNYEKILFQKFKCDLKYISDKLKNVENKTKLSSTHTVTDNGGIPILNDNKLKGKFN